MIINIAIPMDSPAAPFKASLTPVAFSSLIVLLLSVLAACGHLSLAVRNERSVSRQ
jgi:hypothetical protein